MNIDINFHRNKKTKEHLEKINLKCSYSSPKGYYIGFKATVVLNYDSMNPVCISGTPNDAKLFEEILENLQKRQIITKGDTLISKKDIITKKLPNQNHQI